MSIVKKHMIKKWEVTFIELLTCEGVKYKVTRRIPELSVSETKFFDDKRKAKKQFDFWLK